MPVKLQNEYRLFWDSSFLPICRSYQNSSVFFINFGLFKLHKVWKLELPRVAWDTCRAKGNSLWSYALTSFWAQDHPHSGPSVWRHTSTNYSKFDHLRNWSISFLYIENSGSGGEMFKNLSWLIVEEIYPSATPMHPYRFGAIVVMPDCQLVQTEGKGRQNKATTTNHGWNTKLENATQTPALHVFWEK